MRIARESLKIRNMQYCEIVDSERASGRPFWLENCKTLKWQKADLMSMECNLHSFGRLLTTTHPPCVHSFLSNICHFEFIIESIVPECSNPLDWLMNGKVCPAFSWIGLVSVLGIWCSCSAFPSMEFTSVPFKLNATIILMVSHSPPTLSISLFLWSIM